MIRSGFDRCMSADGFPLVSAAAAAVQRQPERNRATRAPVMPVLIAVNGIERQFYTASLGRLDGAFDKYFCRLQADDLRPMSRG